MTSDCLPCTDAVDDATVRKFAAQYLDIDIDDISSIDATEMKWLLRLQGTLDRNDLVHAPFSVAVDVIRQARIEIVGVRQYISDVLSNKAGRDAGEFYIWYGDCVYDIDGRADDRLIDVLADLADGPGLPDSITIKGQDLVFYL
jgi:hypothetical protein